MMFLLEKHFTWVFFSDSGSPVHGESNDTLCASSNRNSWRNTSSKINTYQKLRKTFYLCFFQILYSPVRVESNDTLRALNRSKLVEKHKFKKIHTYQKLFVQCENPEQNQFWNRSRVFANRFQKFFLLFFDRLWLCLMIFSEKTPQKNLDREITKFVILCPS